MTSEHVIYFGRDLEAMAFAANYHRWILEIFNPYLGKRIVEVGAGTGSFSELILERDTESVSLVEPSKKMHAQLNARLRELASPARIETFNNVFVEVSAHLKSTARPDSIIYVNVLEHIENDVAELEAVYRTLESGGRLFVFVPALSWLYGSFDKQIGHFRRYRKRELEDKCRRAGFKIIRSGYFDLAGIAPWWIKYRLLKSTTMNSRDVAFYDKYIVPLMKVIESVFTLPIGKNIILIAEKS